ncbi:MAG: hypothetical protein ABI548_13875 [Polyangiaceae bacterium]
MSTERELEALFRAEQAVTPAADAANHGWQRLASDVAANVAPLPLSTGALKLAAWLVPKWVLLGFAVGLAGTGASATLFGASAPKRQVQALPAPAAVRRLPTQPALVASAKTQAEAAAVVPTASGPSRVAHVAPPAASASSAANAATFDAELKLISRAKGELDARNPRQAQASLAEHAQRFPNGVFAVEREALVILAGCQQEPNNDAAAIAFAERHPGSPLIARLERACQGSADSRIHQMAPHSQGNQ